MRPLFVLSILLLHLCAAGVRAVVPPDQAWAVQFDHDNPIQGLTWKSRRVTVTKNRAGEVVRAVARLKGNFFREDWQLFGGNQRIPNGDFEITVPIGPSLRAWITLTSRHPDGDSEESRIGIVVVKVPSQYTLATKVLGRTPSYLGWRLNGFDAQLVALFQNQGTGTMSAGLAWTPGYVFTPVFSMRMNFGLTFARKREGGIFFISDYQLLFGLAPTPRLIFELGGGAETFIEFGGTQPIATTNVVWILDLTPDSGFSADRLVVGYSALVAANLTHHFRLGVGFRIGKP